MSTVLEAREPKPLWLEVPDVAWCSNEFPSTYGFIDPYAVALEICVQIESSSNTESELQAKVRLYLDASAREVWRVDAKGAVRMHGPAGPLAASAFDVDAGAVAFEPSKAER